jgi:hypothetical protein
MMANRVKLNMPADCRRRAAPCLAIALDAAPASAQIDLAGEWTARSRHEDEVHRIPGPELGD